MDFEEDTYTAIFSALKHPIRRKILRMLEMEPATYTEMMNSLGIETGLLNYHLESLSTLLAKNDEGEYQLTDYGEAALSLTRRVEEPPSGVSFPRMSGGRRVIMALITGLLIIGVSLTAYSMVNMDVELVKIHESIDYGNSWYQPYGLYGLEFYTERPGTLMNFWWKMNTTVDIYVMSRKQYLAQKNMDGPPVQYLRRHTGSQGNITMMTESVNVTYEFAMYTGKSGAWEETHGFSVYRWRPVKQIDNTLLTLNILLILSIVILMFLDTPAGFRLEGIISKRVFSG